jgi:RNA polymerase subunit RPABC4/transcription elongation factor Spt4
MNYLDNFLNNTWNSNWKIYVNYFWESLTIETFIKLIVIYFFVVWISLIIWVYKDVTNRTESIFLQVFSILCVTLFTPLWFFFYLLIRPSKSIFEKFYLEVEENLDTLSDTIKNNIIDCHSCGSSVSASYNFCPHCEVKLKHECSGCKKMIFFDFKVCPYCGKKNKKKKED